MILVRMADEDVRRRHPVQRSRQQPGRIRRRIERPTDVEQDALAGWSLNLDAIAADLRAPR